MEEKYLSIINDLRRDLVWDVTLVFLSILFKYFSSYRMIVSYDQLIASYLFPFYYELITVAGPQLLITHVQYVAREHCVYLCV